MTIDNTLKEKDFIAQMLKKYPPEKIKIFDTTAGIACIYLGDDSVPSPLVSSIKRAKEILNKKFEGKLEKVFTGLKVYIVKGEIEGGGWACSGANAIILDTDKNCMFLKDVEEMLGPNGLQVLNKGDWLNVVEDQKDGKTIAGEVTLIHEIGHILQSKTKTHFNDTENAPTKYGKSKEWEDYAESFFYYCYDKPLEGNRSELIAKDITSILLN